MDFKLIQFTQVDSEQWDTWVSKLDFSTYYHSWSWLNCLSQFNYVKKNLTFALFDKQNDKLLAICPFALSVFEDDEYHYASFGYFPCGVPALATISAKDRRILLDEIFRIFASYIQTYSIVKLSMATHPLNQASFAGKAGFYNEYSMELLRYGMWYQIENTVVIDLSKSEPDLVNDVSRYHFRHVKKARKKGIEVKVYNAKENQEEAEEFFNKMREAHFISAGRETRPRGTWDAMYRGLLDDKASLFVAFDGEKTASYLYCGEFGSMAFGWSQVNTPEYTQSSVRHLLEWEAILFYKKSKKYKFYEVGERYYGPQFFSIPSEKELSISVFKERYGGVLLPTIKWFGYADLDIMKKDLDTQIQTYKSSMSLLSIPT